MERAEQIKKILDENSNDQKEGTGSGTASKKKEMERKKMKVMQRLNVLEKGYKE